MPAYKNKESGTWYVVTQYTDWTGARKQKCKRGFDTCREALEWEQKFQQQSAGDLDMSFEAFVEIYTTDLKSKLKKLLKDAKKTISDLKAKIESLVSELSAVKAELAQYKSVRGKLRTVDLEQENDRLRNRLRTYEDVISCNNLWSYFSRHRSKAPTRDDAR